MFTSALTIVLALTMQPSAPAQADLWPDSRPLTHIVQNLGHDLGNVPSLQNTLIVLVGGMGAAAVHKADQPISTWAAGAGSTAMTDPGNVIGNAVTEGSAALGTYIVGKVAHNAEITHIGGDLIRGQLLNGIFTESLKLAVNRTRPSGSPYSFPSGHSSASFTTATIFARHYGWRLGVPAYVIASYVGFSRIRDNQHWTSDVVFGSALGIMAGRTVTIGHHERAFTVMPAPTRGGAALWVTWAPGQ